MWPQFLFTPCPLKPLWSTGHAPAMTSEARGKAIIFMS